MKPETQKDLLTACKESLNIFNDMADSKNQDEMWDFWQNNWEPLTNHFEKLIQKAEEES